MSALLKPRPQPAQRLTWKEYEQKDAASETKLEFVNGEVHAMAGATDNHNRITLNVASELRQALKGKPCEAFVADMKLRIALGFDELGYYPDVMVVCDQEDKAPLHRTAPKIIVEVVSRSTSRIDRREKLLAYQAIPSLEVYIILEQACMRAVVHRRANHWWPEILEGDDAVITLDELGVRLSFQEVYDRVDWAAVEAD